MVIDNCNKLWLDSAQLSLSYLPSSWVSQISKVVFNFMAFFGFVIVFIFQGVFIFEVIFIYEVFFTFRLSLFWSCLHFWGCFYSLSRLHFYIIFILRFCSFKVIFIFRSYPLSGFLYLDIVFNFEVILILEVFFSFLLVFIFSIIFRFEVFFNVEVLFFF